MIAYSSALEILESVARKRLLGHEEVPLDQAAGRILARTIESSEAVPAFDNSAMDGFAVFSADTAGVSSGKETRLPVEGMLAAGDGGALHEASLLRPGTAIEIMTGAPLPQNGMDAVIRIEDVEVERGSDGRARSIRLERAAVPGANIRRRGTDFEPGQRVVSAGRRIDAGVVMACAGLGVSSLSVVRRPRVAIVSTGSELVPPEERVLAPGKIRNSTGPFLVSVFAELGIEARYHGIISDDPSQYRAVLERALDERSDLIISTGAVSMGQFDFVPQVIEEMGGRIHFHKAAIRPAKPVLFGELGSGARSCAFFGMPGNPVSTAVVFRFFVEPYLRTVSELGREVPVQARLAQGVSKPEGLRCFFKARTRTVQSSLEVEALKGQGSSIVSALVESNSWVVLPEAGSALEAGTLVEVVPLQSSFEQGVLS